MQAAKATDKKKKVVKEFTDLIEKSSIVATVDMENMPAKQLQDMREKLRDNVTIKMTKKRLIKIALENTKDKKKSIEKLEGYLRGMPALLFTDANPFTLYKTLEKRKSSAPAKAGQTAPNDIVIPAGATNFSPGPVIGELGSLGLQTGIENGKVVIKKDKVVVKEGEEISEKVAGILSRLGINPMEVGLGIIAAYEDGEIYTKDVLAIDEDEQVQKIKDAHRWAFNLAMECSIATKETVTLLITKASGEARSLCISEKILADGVKEQVIAKVHQEMLSVASMLPSEAKSDSLNNISVKKEQPRQDEVKKDDDKKPEKVKEEKTETEAASGLGALFG